MLKDYIEQCGAACNVILNDDSELLQKVSKADALVISPGPGTPAQSGKLTEIMRIINHKPILGVCLGHQAIGEQFGATLVKAKLPRHGKADEVYHVQHPLFDGINRTFHATRYHSLILKNVREPLQAIAWTDQQEVMAIAHMRFPVYGIQFHPESCMTECGLTIINNFLRLAKQYA
jgi:anthranilate synthase component 2